MLLFWHLMRREASSTLMMVLMVKMDFDYFVELSAISMTVFTQVLEYSLFYVIRRAGSVISLPNKTRLLWHSELCIKSIMVLVRAIWAIFSTFLYLVFFLPLSQSFCYNCFFFSKKEIHKIKYQFKKNYYVHIYI